MRTFTHLLAAALLGATALVPGRAQDAQSLDEVVVTANKFPQKQLQTGKVLTVLGDSLLRANSGRSLTDVLNQQVGLTVAGSQQPLGSVQSVFMRGAGAGYTLVLIDGVPLYDPSGIEGNFDLNFLPVDQIARVEILKGGQSTLYGSDAVAGVINIITKRSEQTGRPVSANGLLSGGSYATLRGSVGLSGRTNATTYQVQYTRTASRGFSAAYDPAGSDAFERDGFRQHVLRAALTQAIGQRLSLSVSGLYSGYGADLDAGAFTDDRDFRTTQFTRQGTAGLTYEVGRGKLFLNYHVNRNARGYLDDSTSVPDGAFARYVRSHYAALSHFAELYTNLRLSNRLDLVAGADLRAQNTDQHYVSYSAFGPFETPPIRADLARMTIASGFASLLLHDVAGFGAEVGGRYNRHSVYGQNLTYTLNPYYVVANAAGVARLKLLVSLASSFKAPSLYHLYSPYGNLDLRPERSTNLDVGVQLFGRTPQTYIRAVYFRRQIRDAVFFQPLRQEPFGRYVNLNAQNDRGLELDAAYQRGRWQLTANYTYLTGQLTTQRAGRDTTFTNLLRRPRHALNVVAGYAFTARLSANVTVRSVSARPDQFYNGETFSTEAVTLAGYTTVDLYAEYRPVRALRFFADLRNLTNRLYFDVVGFSNRRFNATVGALFSF